MKYVSPSILSSFKKSMGVTGTPEATIEWNLNRFGTDPVMTCPGETGKKDTSMPLSSLVDPERPEKKGAMKAYVEPGNQNWEGWVSNDRSRPEVRRSYVSSEDSKYKYWVSNSKSSNTMTGDDYNITGVAPTVVYRYGLNTNKLYALFETSTFTPRNIRFYVTEDGTNWVQAGGVYQVDPSGVVEIYLQDNGTWNTGTNWNNYKRLKGVRVTVGAMSRPRVRCHMIEMGLRRVIDVTNRLISYSTDFEMSEASFVLPFGKCSTNVGELRLSNHDGYLDNDRTYTDLYNLMNGPAKVEINLNITTDAGIVKTRQATMFVANWNEQTEDSRSLTLEDGSYFLKKIKPPDLLLEKVTSVEAAWRVLDSVGFTNFRVVDSPNGDAKIKYYWTDPQLTVWEHLQALSESGQIAIFFDEYGRLNIQSRRGALDPGKSNAWVFDGENVTSATAADQSRAGDEGKYADIISVGKPHQLYANKVNITYRKTDVSSINKFQPKMNTVWEPEGTVALRSATLARPMTRDQEFGIFSNSNFATWPYRGFLQIDGEIMEWTNKRYAYYDANGKRDYKYIKSDESREALDALNPYKSHLNKFDGCLYFGDRRGVMSTVARAHRVTHEFHTIRTRHKNGTMLNKAWYAAANYKTGMYWIKTTKKFSMNSWTTSFRGQRPDQPPKYAGTSIYFSRGNGYSRGCAGMMFGLTDNDAGYYVELTLTSVVGQRKNTNEVSIYTRGRNGSLKRVGKGGVAAIAKGVWYDLDVKIENWRISVYLNGMPVTDAVIPVADRLESDFSGYYGVFARGHTHAAFEYLYATNSIETDISDDATRMDLIGGGYRSNYYNKFIYRKNISERLSGWSEDRITQNAGFAFDEFGAIAHEVRQFDVKFDPKPVIHSRLYLSNEWTADCVEYIGSWTGAKFTIAGKARAGNVILNGSDVSIFGSENPVDQRMLVYGRVVNQGEDEIHTVKRDKSIRKVGEVEVDINSTWIQSKSQAEFLGEWITDHWQDGSEVVEIETFGNPFVEVGDVVGVSYLRKSMRPATHRYYVVGVSNSFDMGLTSRFKLQKVASP